MAVLKDVHLELESGKTYAFLGPNGSGKTTIIKSILGMVKPDKGTVTIDGEVVNNRWQYRQNIGYMPQIASFPDNLRLRELLKMVKNIRREQTGAKEEMLLRYFSMEAALDKKVKNFSGGMKQKVNAIIAFLFDPQIYIFDEPSVGLDPISHIKLKQLIRQEVSHQKTLLLTSHILGDVEELADEIVYLLDGRIFFKGSPAELLKIQNETRIDHAIAKLADPAEYGELLKTTSAAAECKERIEL